MKKEIAAALALGILASGMMAGCTSGTTSTGGEEISVKTPAPAASAFTHKTSEDKHIAYVDNYVGMNCANVGYSSLGGDRRDYLGAATVVLEFVTEDGSYLGPDDEDALKDYVVTAQNVAPNTEVQLVFQTDENGEEYDSLIAFQTVDEIDLAVKKAGEAGNGPQLVEIKPSPDKYTAYIRNYVGKNLAVAGYESMAGDYRDAYGAGNIELKVAAEDGSYVDISDADLLKQYVITAQSVEPNTAVTYTYMKQSDGTEYDNLIDSQSIDSITLNVRKLAGDPARASETEGAANGEDAEAALAEAEEADTDLAADAEEEASSMLNAAKDTLGNVVSGLSSLGQSAEDQYKSIYDDYSAQLKAKSGQLVQEYYTEAAGNSSGIEGLAEICNNKIEALAELSNEGVEKMAEVYWTKGSSDYDTYEKWSGDLYDVYMEESEKITDAYMSSF